MVWSWDITKLRGPDRGLYFDLYVILDINSRYVVGWTLAPSESGELAKDRAGYGPPRGRSRHGRPIWPRKKGADL